jgi:hypothetical protein
MGTRVPKTSRTTATVRAADLSTKLQVDRSVIYKVMKRLGINAYQGFGHQIYFTPAQAQLIEQQLSAGGVGGGSESTPQISILGSDKAKALFIALEKGATAIQLVTEHGASPNESDAACAWWNSKRDQMVFTSLEMKLLKERIGTFKNGVQLVSLIEEAIVTVQTCNACGHRIHTPLCRSCQPRLGRPPKPTTPLTPLLDPDMERDFEELERRVNGSTGTDPTDSITETRRKQPDPNHPEPAPE